MSDKTAKAALSKERGLDGPPMYRE